MQSELKFYDNIYDVKNKSSRVMDMDKLTEGKLYVYCCKIFHRTFPACWNILCQITTILCYTSVTLQQVNYFRKFDGKCTFQSLQNTEFSEPWYKVYYTFIKYIVNGANKNI